jgi:Tfp pilus assembly protein FimT
VRRNGAFTLYELIMVIVLVSIIFAVTAPLMLEIGRSWQLAQNRNELSESSKVGMNRMVREIRQILNATSVITANSTTFKFTDINSNIITYNVSGGHLMRILGATSNQLADNVTALLFTYYDTTEAVIATPIVNPSSTNITRIVIDLTFSVGGTSLSFESGVSPRSLQ